MQCHKCNYVCTPYDHGNDGGPTWQCERCRWACKVNSTPRDVDTWEQAMKMQNCVDEQSAHDWFEEGADE